MKMSNGIGFRQNEEKSIVMLAAQRQLYNEVGKLEVLNIVFLVVLPFMFAILQEVVPQWNWICFFSYGMTLTIFIISVFINKACKNKKDTAASIQLLFDTYVYSMPWDDKLFGKQKNWNSIISEKSSKILNDEKEKKALRDWYTPIVDQMTLEKGIFTCQKENYHWDGGLRKRYRGLAIVVIAIIVGVIFIIGIVSNEPFQKFIAQIIFVLPMLRWLIGILTGVNDDLGRLKELDGEFNSIENKSMSELQIIQKSITEHRKAALKIPNVVYLLFKNNDEDKEHMIAIMDSKR